MNSKIDKWTRDSEKEILKTSILSVHSHHASSHEKTGTFYSIKAPDWINVIAQTTSGEIILVKQYRHGIDAVTLEIPGGAIDKNEDPLLAAKRELLEETGYESDNWTFLGKTAVNPAFMTNYTHLFYAKDCKLVSAQDLDEMEEIEILSVSEQEFLDWIKSGKIDHSLIWAGVAQWLLKIK
ncbi:NUDIX hydrolase [bacterium]|nr:MAG: NUDIX hydrolase [bacterium]